LTLQGRNKAYRSRNNYPESPQTDESVPRWPAHWLLDPHTGKNINPHSGDTQSKKTKRKKKRKKKKKKKNLIIVKVDKVSPSARTGDNHFVGLHAQLGLFFRIVILVPSKDKEKRRKRRKTLQKRDFAALSPLLCSTVY
jgi:hypothetical protein